MPDKKWIQKAVNKMKQKGTVGTFTKAAKAHHMGVMEYAREVVSNPNVSGRMKKRAQFVMNVNK